MRNVVLRVSIVVMAAGLVAGRAGAQVGFGVLAGGTVPSGSFSDVAASGWNAGGFVSFGRGDAAFKLRVEGLYHDFGKKDVTSTSGPSSWEAGPPPLPGPRTSAGASSRNHRFARTPLAASAGTTLTTARSVSRRRAAA